jgi:hypothetical protein
MSLFANLGRELGKIAANGRMPNLPEQLRIIVGSDNKYKVHSILNRLSLPVHASHGDGQLTIQPVSTEKLGQIDKFIAAFDAVNVSQINEKKLNISVSKDMFQATSIFTDYMVTELEVGNTVFDYDTGTITVVSQDAAGLHLLKQNLIEFQNGYYKGYQTGLEPSLKDATNPRDPSCTSVGPTTPTTAVVTRTALNAYSGSQQSAAKYREPYGDEPTSELNNPLKFN